MMKIVKNEEKRKKKKNVEKSRNMKKIQEKIEKSRKMRIFSRLLRFCLHTQNLRRFQEFAFVVVTFFDEISDDFHDFVFGMCLSPQENQQPVLGGHRFSEEK